MADMSDEQRSGMLASRDRFAELLNAKQDAKMTDLYTEDCRIMAAGKDVVIGKQGIANEIAVLRKIGVAKITTTCDEVGHIDENTGYTTGKFTLYREDGSEIGRGADVSIWKKVDGVYLLHVDIWNHT
ncbi:uncharacterized protein LOC144438312 [Glandiceps talaboti]